MLSSCRLMPDKILYSLQLGHLIKDCCAQLVIILSQSTTCTVADTAKAKQTLKLLLNKQLHGIVHA